MADKKEEAAPRKAATKAVKPWKNYVVEMLLKTDFPEIPSPAVQDRKIENPQTLPQ